MEQMMIPHTLTTTQAQQLLARGRARQQSPECLTTPRAIYYWNADTQQYEREADFRPVGGAPRPSASATREARYGIVGTLVLLLFLAPGWDHRPALLILSLLVLLIVFVRLLIAAVVFLGRWALSRLPRERR
jgi:hypothetical protein